VKLLWRLIDALGGSFELVYYSSVLVCYIMNQSSSLVLEMGLIFFVGSSLVIRLRVAMIILAIANIGIYVFQAE